MTSWANQQAMTMESEQVQRHFVVTYKTGCARERESNVNENAQDSDVSNLVNASVFIRGQSRAAIGRDADVLSFRQAESEILPRQLSNGVRDLGKLWAKDKDLVFISKEIGRGQQAATSHTGVGSTWDVARPT